MMRITIILFIGVVHFAFGQQNLAVLQERMDNYNETISPEFISIHTDKTVYFAGERLWYSLYLNNVPRSVTALSTIAYVEIRDARDTVLLRQKIRCNNGLAHGDLLIPRTLLSGNYQLVSYTLWMKNQAAITHYRSTLPVINLDVALTTPLTSQSRLPLLSIIEREPRMLEVTSRNPDAVTMIVFTRDEALQHTRFTPDTVSFLDCTEADGDEIFVALVDVSGKVIERNGIRIAPKNLMVQLETERKSVGTRQRMTVSIGLRDAEGNPVTGNVSLSVRRKTSVRDSNGIPSFPDGILPEVSVSDTPVFKKELFVHPASPHTMGPLSFGGSAVPDPLDIDPVSMEEFIAEGNQRKIMMAYDLEPLYQVESNYNVPANISFEPAQYQTLGSIGDFLKELVPQVRVRSTRSGNRMFVRYSGTNDVHFFREPALVLLNGAILNSIDRILEFPQHEIERVDITWSGKEINSVGLFSIADYGIVSIVTRNKAVLSGEVTPLLSDFHTPLRFDITSAKQETNLPAFENPVLWNPDIRVAGRSRIDFEVGDLQGDFIVEIYGLTDRGQRISKSVSFRVTRDR